MLNCCYRVRHLQCWDQFVSLLYAQLTGCRSLRKLEVSFNSHSERHYHLGCHSIKRSTLSKAKENRPVSIYEELCSTLITQLLGDDKESKEALLLLDSTTVGLNKTRYEWAEYRNSKSGVKLHLAYDPRKESPCFFSITPAKHHDMKAAEQLTIQPNSTYVFDRAYNAYDWWKKLDDNNCTFVARQKSKT